MKSFWSSVLLGGLLCSVAHAGSGIVTIISTGSNTNGIFVTNSITIAEDEVATIQMLQGNGHIDILKGNASRKIDVQDLLPTSNAYIEHPVVAGPATFYVVTDAFAATDSVWATLDIQPSQYPPDKAAVIGPHSGPMRVTMETSTDLVNWGVATNDVTYPDSEGSRFFRIKLLKDIP